VSAAPLPVEGARRAARRLAAGCVAGMALASGASWLRYLLERTPRLDTGTIPFLAAAFLAGLGICLAGWWSLRLAPVARALGRAELLGLAVAVHLAAAPALPLTSSDVYSYLAHGELQRLGRSPYLTPPSALAGSPLLEGIPPRWAGVPSVYGPVVNLASRLAAGAGAALGHGWWGPLAAFKLLMAGCAILAVVLAWAILRRRGPEGAGPFALFATSPLVAWEISGQAHNDGLVLLLVTVAAAALCARRRVGVCAASALAACAKIPIAPLFALALAAEARRSWRRAALLALGGAAVAAAAVAPYWRGAGTFRGSAAVLRGDAALHAHSLVDLICLCLGALGRADAAGAAWRALGLASTALCVLALVWAAWRARDAASVLRGFAVICLVWYLTTPWFQPWYASWIMPLLLVERDARWRRFVALFGILAVAQWILPLDPVSTVAVDAWAAWTLVHLLRSPAHEAGEDQVPEGQLPPAVGYQP
jgi:alpha-1,6-mannosyltransferase